MNKAQYKESDCAKELKRASITSFFSASPKKKPKLEEGSDADATTATATVHEKTCTPKAEPGVKNEQLSNVKADCCEVQEVSADQLSKEDLEGVGRVFCATCALLPEILEYVHC